MGKLLETKSWPNGPRGWISATVTLAAARECLRSLWNQHYRCLANQSEVFDVIDAYKATRRKVLSDYLDLCCHPKGSVFVKISSSVQPQAVLLRDQTAPQIIKWKQLPNAERFEGQLFLMIDFFDFDEQGWIDLRYVEMESVDLETLQPNNKSRLLAEFQHCEFGIPSE
jgi:hypothetical protein